MILGSPRFFAEDSPRSVVELQTMLLVDRVVGDGNEGVREVLAKAENYSELAREQGAPTEIGNVLTQFLFSEGTVLSGGTSGTGCPTRQPIGGEGTSECWGTMATAPISSNSVDTKPRIGSGGAGDSVFLVWSVGILDQPVLPGGHWFSETASIGQCGLAG